MVFVVDFDLLMMIGVVVVLYLLGYESYCVWDLVVVKKVVEELFFDLVICDVNLEGESGIEFCWEI